MSRYIDANWIAQELEWWRDKLAETHGENDEYVLCLGEVLMKLDDTPTADVRENVMGTCYCDQCGFNSVIGGNYCPNCGADMRGEA